jgi:hypothetical protein
MTAPLPPPSIRLADGGYYSEPLLKLIVREALERAIAPCTDIVDFFQGSENMHPLHIRERDTAKEIADAIRAMLKEYE